MVNANSELKEKITSTAGHLGKIIAAISPESNTSAKDEGMPRNIKGFQDSLKKDFWQTVNDMGSYNLKPNAVEEHVLTYDSSSETLEPIYFWLVDFMEKRLGDKPEKLVDNFTSSPGSGHFSELMGKATRMQEESMKILGSINVVIKSVVNIIYDLKEFEIRLSHYTQAESDDKDKAEAGNLALKQIWMDNVDMKKGVGSINGMSQQLNFVTLRDAFMAAKDESLKDEQGREMDLNDRVKRILKPRIAEFLQWRKLSHVELKKRYDIEKNYLKSQINSLKLYTRWVKPYLKAAAQLEQKEIGGEKSPDMVRAFNTILFELALWGKQEIDVQQEVYDGTLPQGFEKAKTRKYHSCVLVDFYFRGLPQKVGQHYAFGGRAEVTFKGYTLNEDELKILEKKLEESNLNEALKLVSGTTDESLENLREDIEYFLEKEDKIKEEQEKSKGEDVNPFSALIGMGGGKAPTGVPSETEGKEKIVLKKESFEEKSIRTLAEGNAKSICFDLFDIYKKAHGMPSWDAEYPEE